MNDCCKKKIRNEEDKKKIITRINKIKGQLDGINKMIDEDRYCPDILIQLSAIDSALKSLSTIILDEHLHTCLINSIKNGDESAIDEVTDLFKRFTK